MLAFELGKGKILTFRPGLLYRINKLRGIFNLVFHHPTPGWGGENFDFGDEQNDEDSTNGCCFCVSVLHMSKLKGAVAAGVCVRLSRSNKSPAKVGPF